MDIQPRFRCVACHRGVLNRSVPRCLYCGADLPAQARLAPEVIAQRDAEHARLEVAPERLAQAAPATALRPGPILPAWRAMRCPESATC